MRSILVAIFSISLVLSISACSDDGKATGDNTQIAEHTTRIVGGSSYDGLPAVGMLVYNGNPHCTGTVIGPRLVVTAGHCVNGFSASRMQFAIGPDGYNPQALLAVSSTEPHPGYNASNITNDIALVHLAQDAPVEPMGVVTNMDSSWVGKQLFFVGYGVDNGYNQTGAGKKRAVWMALSGVSSTQFRYEDPNANTCNGDSGGPAFYRDSNGKYLVAGVTSYGDQYCAQYGVDTRVDAYLDWIGIGDNPDPDPQQDPCNGETYEGRCDGQTVVWCENNKVNRQDCAADGKVCAYSDEHGYYGCAAQPDPQPTDPCNGETFEGRCDGQTVIWCENDQVNQQDCSADNKQCTFDSDKGYYACRDAQPVDPCNGETWEGRCEGGSVIWCENDKVNSLNCSQYGKSCGLNNAKGYYDCL